MVVLEECTHFGCLGPSMLAVAAEALFQLELHNTVVAVARVDLVGKLYQEVGTRIDPGWGCTLLHSGTGQAQKGASAVGSPLGTGLMEPGQVLVLVHFVPP